VKPLITLKPLLHRGGEQIGIYFQNNLPLNIVIRTKAAGKWSQTHKCWYVPMNRESFEKIKAALPAVNLDSAELKKYLVNKNRDAKKSSALIRANQTFNHFIQPVNSDHVKISDAIAPVNKHVLPSMQQMLKLKAFSQSTIRTYLNEMAQLLTTIKDIPANELKPEHLKRYLVYCYEKLGLKENTLHSRINAMKFYYEQVLKREKFFWEIPRPKKQQLLPRFFSQNDLVSIIKATGNIKHKVMLMLCYSAGLRVSEVVSMKTRNIDESRMSILIEQAKGKKDRMVTLSPVLLVMLRKYINEYQPDPKGYLFAGQWKEEPYSSRSLQLVLAAAKKKAGVLKPGSVHALRHSFATHLLDKGTDVTIIMKLLGHNDIKTTLRYLHVTNRDILQIVSPLDDLNLE